MNLTELLSFIPLIIGGFLAYHLIFKQNLPGKNLAQIITYFIGVVIVLLALGWLMLSFLPGWVQNLINAGTDPASNWTEVIDDSETIFDDAFGSDSAAAQPTAQPTVVQVLVPVTVAPNTVPLDGGTNLESLSGPTSYTVVAGDTLHSIARRFGVNVNDLRVANGIPQSSALIQVGQQLTIPAPGQ
ncbi:MAG: LysM peptidoglycan-binding domain-containing protein [Chloroflexi bacterium]|nr:MAG: LysM peptidoglycan-binding domain-containing protein [Chloroflexota bacterium]